MLSPRSGVFHCENNSKGQGWQGWWKHRGQLREGHVRV